jgi:hypothetical protein
MRRRELLRGAGAAAAAALTGRSRELKKELKR